MTATFYTLLLYLLAPVIWAYLGLRALKAPEYRQGWLQRLGILPEATAKQVILVHCASVGEVRAAAPLLRRLQQTYPANKLVVSTTTPTGKQALAELLGDQVAHVFFPVDWPGSVARFIRSLEPKLVVLMETELWLNFLKACDRKQVPVLLANARLSDQSLAKYQKREKFSRQLFSLVDQIGAQYPKDKNNFCALGVSSEGISVTGSIKFDLTVSDQLKTQQAELKALWAPNRPVWLAASIHPDEFAVLLSAHKTLLAQWPDLLLIAIPRHPEKFELMAQACADNGLDFIRRTSGVAPGAQTQVVVGDTMGEVTLFCGLSQIAMVGGSLIPRGGHNPLEPLACGNALLMGPHVYNFDDICRALSEQGLLQTVDDAAGIAAVITDLLSDPDKLAHISAKGHDFMRQNQGCVERLEQLALGLYSGDNKAG